jgi:hypothetical protein
MSVTNPSKKIPSEKPRSAEEVAEEIRCWIADQCVPETNDDIQSQTDYIAKALNAFAEERVREDHKKALDVSGFVEIARAEALEEAAKVCDAPIDELLVSRRPGYVLAERIRALKPNEGAEG